jgi:hypothetical protein
VAAITGLPQIADVLGLGHQAGAEAALLHPIRRAPDIEIDLVIAQILSDAGVAAMKASVWVPVTVKCRIGIEQDALRAFAEWRRRRSPGLRCGAHCASARGSEPPSCSATGCSNRSKPMSSARLPCSMAPVVTISV